MTKAAKNEGIEIKVVSAYRSMIDKKLFGIVNLLSLKGRLQKLCYYRSNN